VCQRLAALIKLDRGEVQTRIMQDTSAASGFPLTGLNTIATSLTKAICGMIFVFIV
jgi:hypothetical protein